MFLQDSLESKNAACKDFFSCLNESWAVWGGRLPVDARYINPLAQIQETQPHTYL